MTIHRPLEIRTPSGGTELEFVSPRAPLPWISTIARLRSLCGPWLIAVVALAFLPGPMRAQPAPRVRTAMRITPETMDPGDSGSIEPGSEPALEAPDAEVRTAESSAENSKPGGAPAKMLVLKNGKLVEGRISQSAGGYVVDRPNGTMLIPFDRVSFEAQDRKDAYQKVRSKMPAKSARSNIALARWCLTYNMLDETESELRQALELEPYCEEARTMLRRLEEIRNPDQPLHKDTPSAEPKTSDGFLAPDVESLGGFTKESAQEFVVRVQPILINKCGNASCHGGATTRDGFQLNSVRSGRGNRTAAERNLAAVLHYVDFQSPEASELLTIPRGSHGGSRAIFFGPKAAEQWDTLRDWVVKASKEQRAQSSTRSDRGQLAKAGRPQSRPADSRDEAPVIVPAPEDEFDPPSINSSATSPKRRSTNAVPHTKERPATIEKTAGRAVPATDRLKQILKEEQPDPFDPGEFNKAAAQSE